MFQTLTQNSLNVQSKVSAKHHSNQNKANHTKDSLSTRVKMIKWTLNVKVKKVNWKYKSMKPMMLWIKKCE